MDHVELDTLHWLTDWQPRALPEFRSLVSRAIAKPRWVLDGNNSKVRDLVWPSATDLIWLNYRFPVVFGRALRRTLRRIVQREQLFAGNHESHAKVLFDRESILWWVIRTYKRRRMEYPQLFMRTEHAHLRVFELKIPEEAVSLLEGLQKSIG